MSTNSYIQVSNTFTIIKLIAESTLKLKNDTESKIFANPVFEIRVFTLSGLIVFLILKQYFYFKIINNNDNDFFSLALLCKYIEARYGRSITRDFVLYVRVVS